MNRFGKYVRLEKLRWIIPLLFLIACVDRLYFDVPQSGAKIVVEGMIHDGPGPYSVKVTESVDLDADSLVSVPIQNVKIRLYDDQGNSEDLLETDPGTYLTGGIIQGKIGHAYHIQLQTPGGDIFESEPDSIKPVGDVENITFEFESRISKKKFGKVQADVFNIFVDSYAGAGKENYVRWKYTGTYRVISFPELHYIWSEGYMLPDPYPCSGWIVDPEVFGGVGDLIQVADCTCCTCWANEYEEKPTVSNGDLIVNNRYQHIKVAEVPISPPTFYDKFMVVVEQMSLSRKSYEFFKLLGIQKDGPKNLFQPPSGTINGNIKAVNSTGSVVGLFYATSINTKKIFINKSDLPYPVIPIAAIRYPCTWYPNSTTTKPALWE